MPRPAPLATAVPDPEAQVLPVEAGPAAAPVRRPDLARVVRAPVQRSFDDMGLALVDVTFVVFDLETTGASPADCAITEIGAVKVRGGECLGRFHTLVNPGLPIPPMITVLTGITDALVAPAPGIAEVLPSFCEFVAGAVLVGHNVGFDIGFSNAALRAHGYPQLANPKVDTLALARRLVLDEVPNLRLSTLARHLRAGHAPCHRALDDALATTDVLHALLERAGSFGVTALDDLLALPTLACSAASAKLGLTRDLPRCSGVYLFRDRRGEVLYVGKATNLRARVRSYFASETRRKVPQLLRETHRIDHVPTGTLLEAEVLELRLIHEHEPRYNRRGRRWRSYVYLKLTSSERFPRLTTVRTARPGDGPYLGPFSSTASARAVQEAVETAIPLRRCGRRITRRAVPGDGLTCPAHPCVGAQLAVSSCPCSGATTADDYAAIVATAVRALTDEPGLVIDPLQARMLTLARQARFEEAAATRDRLAAFSRAVRLEREVRAWRRAGRVILHVRAARPTASPPAHRVELDGGSLVAVEPWQPVPRGLELESAPPTEAPPTREEIDELVAVTRWLQREAAAGRVRLVRVERPLSVDLPWPESFEAVVPPGAPAGRARRSAAAEVDGAPALGVSSARPPSPSPLPPSARASGDAAGPGPRSRSGRSTPSPSPTGAR
jgi:DNA polymerase-3 subunit epsilon